MLIDADYIMDRYNNPVIRLYCKGIDDKRNGEDVVLHVNGFSPYIYVGDCGLDIFDLQKIVENVGKGYIKRCDIVKKFLPIGYQLEKSNFLKLTLFSPKVVRDLRQILKEKIKEMSDAQFFEADIPFHNRFLVDSGINGMDIIEFNHVGKELKNYGLNCNDLYIIDKSEIRVLKEELVKIEY